MRKEFTFENVSLVTVNVIFNGLLNDVISHFVEYDDEGSWGFVNKFDMLSALRESDDDLGFFANLMAHHKVEVVLK